jgi:hypothetical protein
MMNMKMQVIQFVSILNPLLSMRRIASERLSRPRVLSSHLLHFADANDAEITVNHQFFHALEFMASPVTELTPNQVIRIFRDFLGEARKLQRLDARGGPHEMGTVNLRSKSFSSTSLCSYGLYRTEIAACAHSATNFWKPVIWRHISHRSTR